MVDMLKNKSFLIVLISLLPSFVFAQISDSLLVENPSKDSLMIFEMSKKDSLSTINENNDSLSLNTKNKTRYILIDTLGMAKYGLRIGVDLFNTLVPLWNKNIKKSWEVNADYRLNENLYLAAGFGTKNQYFDFSTQKLDIDGIYAKLGVNYSVLNGIISSGDIFYFGAKFLYSNFSQNIFDSFIPPDYWHPQDTYISFKDKINSYSLEFSIGVEVKLFWYLYAGIRGGYCLVLGSNNSVNNYKLLAAPGLGQVYNGSSGFNLSYSLSFLIPFYEKPFVKKKKETSEEKRQREQTAEEKIFEATFKTKVIVEE